MVALVSRERSRGERREAAAHLILKMAVSQEQKPCGDTRQRSDASAGGRRTEDRPGRGPYVVPLLKVHRAGDGCQALVSVLGL